MRGFVGALSVLLASAPAAGEETFRIKPALDYGARQEQAGVTVAVKAYRSEEEQKEAFGKAQPYKYGFLPVLVVITNDSEHPVSLEKLKVRFINSKGEGLEPTSGEYLTYYNPKGHQPKDKPVYIPIPLGGPKVKKGPLAQPEITQREFKAPVVAPKSTAGGFFYYQVGSNPALPGSTMYLSGMRDLTTGSELFYFEIPLEGSH